MLSAANRQNQPMRNLVNEEKWMKELDVMQIDYEYGNVSVQTTKPYP